MWTRTENGETAKPLEKEIGNRYVIVRKGFEYIEETEDKPAHWEYDEWQMTLEQYEVYKTFDEQVSEQADALIEIADILAEVLD